MNVAFVVFDRMTALDFIGVYDPLTRLKTMELLPDLEWRICSTKKRVTDDRGLKLLPDLTGEPLADFDMVVVAGGLGTRTLMHDQDFVQWLSTASAARMKVSVCTGSLLLGACGFLKDKRATTHPNAFKELEPYCARVVRERIVDEGSVVTSGGVMAGIDLGLHLVNRLAGEAALQEIMTQMDFKTSPAH